MKKIKAGEEITVNHLGAFSCILMLNRERRKHIIEQTRHFICSCDFCEVDDIPDPTTNYKKLEAMIKEEEELRKDLTLARCVELQVFVWIGLTCWALMILKIQFVSVSVSGLTTLFHKIL